MEFTNIRGDTDCDCLNGNTNPSEYVFARKIGKGKTPKDRDFKSHWEREKRPDDLNNCEEVCGMKGISIDRWDDESQTHVWNHYKTTFGLSPKAKNHLIIFELDPNSGLTKPTPFTGNPFHWDLYKSDEFDLTFVKVKEVRPITSSV